MTSNCSHCSRASLCSQQEVLLNAVTSDGQDRWTLLGVSLCISPSYVSVAGNPASYLSLEETMNHFWCQENDVLPPPTPEMLVNGQ